MAMSLDAAASAMREAMRETVRRYSLLYLVQGILMVVTGVLALIYPWIASIAIVRLLGWFLMIGINRMGWKLQVAVTSKVRRTDFFLGSLNKKRTRLTRRVMHGADTFRRPAHARDLSPTCASIPGPCHLRPNKTS